MKKTLIVLSLALFAVSFTACGGDGSDPPNVVLGGDNVWGFSGRNYVFMGTLVNDGGSMAVNVVTKHSFYVDDELVQQDDVLIGSIAPRQTKPYNFEILIRGPKANRAEFDITWNGSPSLGSIAGPEAIE